MELPILPFDIIIYNVTSFLKDISDQLKCLSLNKFLHKNKINAKYSIKRVIKHDAFMEKKIPYYRKLPIWQPICKYNDIHNIYNHVHLIQLHLMKSDMNLLNVLPKTVKQFKIVRGIASCFSKTIIPETVKYLSIGCDFSIRLTPGMIPKGIIMLKLHGDFNRVLWLGVIPQTVKILRISGKYDQKIKPGYLPESIETLIFGSNMNMRLKPGAIPSSIKEIIVEKYVPKY